MSRCSERPGYPTWYRNLCQVCCRLLLLPTVLLTVMLSGSIALAQIHVDQRAPGVAITPHLSYFLAPAGSHSLEDVLHGGARHLFRRNANQDLNLGFLPGRELWVHFTLVYDHHYSDGGTSIQRFLTINYPALESFTVYLIQNGDISSHTLGDKWPFTQRLVADTPYIIPVTLQGQQPLDVYIHVSGESAYNLPITLLSHAALSEARGHSRMGHGLYFGLMLTMAMIGIFVYLGTRIRIYLWYSLHVLSFGLLLATTSGVAYQYLWPQLSGWNRYADAVMIGVACGLGTWYAREFLNTAAVSRPLHRLMNLIIGLAAAGVAATFFIPHYLIVTLLISLTLITAVVNILAGAMSLYRGEYAAQYFMLGWLCLLSGAVIHALLPLGLIPVTDLTVNASKVGSMLEVLFLAIALSHHARQVGRQHHEVTLQTKRQLQIANDELSLALAKLEQTNSLKDQFLTTISHELRTPMNGVLGVLELLQQSAASDEQRKQLQSAQGSAEEMLTLVETILNFTELQAGRLKLKMERFEPRQLLNHTAQIFRQIAMNKQLNFHFHIEREVPSELMGDGDMLRQVVTQLLDNAVKFTHQGEVCACISVEPGERDDDCILMIQVRDSGPGIPDAQRQTIFEAFRQLDSDNSRMVGGLGIGLTICRHIVLNMEGTLDVSSIAGRGTMFSVLLPFKRVRRDAPAAAPQSLLPAGHTVLVAEDNPVNQMVLSKLLEGFNCRVLIAANGVRVLELLASQPVDLVMMDCQMPIMDGFECARRIRDSQSHIRDIPIIAVTANAMTGDSELCLKAGMNDYIKKPINRDIVERKLRRWLRTRDT